MSQNHIGSPVATLLACAFPSAIARLVIAFVVQAVYGKFFVRAWANIGKEVFKGFPPAFANRYAARAVVSVLLGILVMASLNHVLPGVKFLSLGFAMCGNIVQTQTATAKRFAVSQISMGNTAYFPALATAIPEWLAGASPSKAGNKPAAKGFAGVIG